MTQLPPAPFFDDIAGAPADARAFWTFAQDGVRLRLAVLAPPPQDCRGTVLLFQGRAEHAEKYGPAVTALQERGFGCLTIDWRGQGLADRPAENPAVGHVARFADYQHDVTALAEAALALDLPRPFFLLAHSMGGCIALRALHRQLKVRAVVLAAPMWGLRLPGPVRPLVRTFAGVGMALGLGERRFPATGAGPYVLSADFDDNNLTRDRLMFDWMRRQLRAHPELGGGGPSVAWLAEALRETRALRTLPMPSLPCLTWAGSAERIVDLAAIRRVMADWPGGQLHIAPGARHEMMMELPPVREGFLDAAAAHFSRHSVH